MEDRREQVRPVGDDVVHDGSVAVRVEHAGAHDLQVEGECGAYVGFAELSPQLLHETAQARGVRGGAGRLERAADAEEGAAFEEGERFGDHAFLGAEVVQEHAVAGAEVPGQRAQGEIREAVAQRVGADTVEQGEPFGRVGWARHEGSWIREGAPMTDYLLLRSF
ncbi:hypothetical protein ACQ4WX_41785 [Streptomyces lasalocidi]